MPRVYYALLLSLFVVAPMTPFVAATPPGASGFNVPLREEARKSTTPAPSREATTLKCSSPQVNMTVVLDAGHGGKDPGGMGNNSQEKEIALKIAQLLALGIRTNFPTVEVIMTRSDDTFIPLYERAAIANDAGADLFISIHANIMPGSSRTFGTETFVMGQHVARHNLAVAKRENASILLEDQGKVQQNYGYDPNSDEGHILMSTFQHAFLERSIQFADLVEKEFAAAGRKSRGVKQAGFVVLKETTMPAVLVETGFMSNPEEEAYLLSGVGQQKLANALLKAFRSYLISSPSSGVALSPGPNRSAAANGGPRERGDGKSGSDVEGVGRFALFDRPAPVIQPTVATISVQEREVAPQNRASLSPQRQWTARSVSPSPITYTAPPNVQTGTPISAPASPRPVSSRPPVNVLQREVNTAGNRPSVYAYSAYPPVAAPAEMATDTVPGGYKFKTAKQRQAPPKPKRKLLKDIPDSQLTYSVQLIATKRDLDLTTAPWNKVPYPIKKVVEGGYNKYRIVDLDGAAPARVARDKAKEVGLYDAMVVVYYQGRRLHASQVQALLTR